MGSHAASSTSTRGCTSSRTARCTPMTRTWDSTPPWSPWMVTPLGLADASVCVRCSEMRWAAISGLCLALTASASGPKPPRPEGVSATGSTSQREVLGRALFFDLSLSADGRVGCMTCHLPERVFSDRDARSLGAHLRVGTRNAPSLLDVAEARTLFWDGRRTSLEALILDPLLHPQEHALTSAEDLVARVRGRHAAAHALAFPDEEVSARTITGAIA